ncbi:MAG: hypothetical protein AAFZ15_10870 [Bacteroidota bacterium]
MDNIKLFQLIEFSSYTIALPLLFAFFRIRRSNHVQFHLCLLIFVGAIVELSSYYIIEVLKASNLVVLHIYTVIEFGLIVFIFKNELLRYLSVRNIYLLIFGFAIFALFNNLILERQLRIDALVRAVEAILVITMVLVFFYTTLKTLKLKRLEGAPIFWVSSGLLFYFSTSLFIFIYSNYLIESREASYFIWGLHAIMNTVQNICYTIALWVKPEIE